MEGSLRVYECEETHVTFIDTWNDVATEIYNTPIGLDTDETDWGETIVELIFANERELPDVSNSYQWTIVITDQLIGDLDDIETDNNTVTLTVHDITSRTGSECVLQCFVIDW